MKTKRQTGTAQIKRAGEKHEGEARGAPADHEKKIEYQRTRDLPKLVALWPSELGDGSPAGREKILAKLRQALRAERRRGQAGHWTYDLVRHAQLVAAYNAEKFIYGGQPERACAPLDTAKIAARR